ncbi:VWA domain-containing protein, partial [Variovorax sp. CT11-76]
MPARGPATTDVQLLVDCSGSMAGDSIDAARRALQSIVSRMGAGDRFSLSRFGTTVEHRSRGLWQLTEVTRLAAQRWIGALQADLGGTEMESALASTFALGAGASSDVLVVTDGEISAIDATVESARASGHRVFVVGIGSSPAESHLRRLAEATGGACDFVAPGEAVEPAVLRMFARLRSP